VGPRRRGFSLPLNATKCPLKTTSGRLIATFDRWFVIFKRCNAANKGSCVAINRLDMRFKPPDVSVNRLSAAINLADAAINCDGVRQPVMRTVSAVFIIGKPDDLELTTDA